MGLPCALAMNNATVTYSENLASFVIGSGEGEQIGTALGTWEEL